jgi:hypothetical protein
MSTINDGGPAFPVNELDQITGNVCAQHLGMSYRRYLAAKAMQALIAEGAGFNSDPGQITPMCRTAFDWADAMLKARDGK